MLSKKLTLPFAAAAMLGIGCQGSVDLGNGPGPDEEPVEIDPNADNDNTEQVLFDTTVAPILANSCTDGSGACHTAIAPVFIIDGAVSYDRVVGLPELHGNFTVDSAKMITQVDEGHYEVVYTEAERTDIEFWITSESAIREGDVPDIVQTDLQALEEFSGCMTLANWEASDMGDWAQHRAGGLPCASCHAGGSAGFNTNPDDEQMFLKNRQYEPNAFILGFFQVQPDEITGDPIVVPARTKLEVMSDPALRPGSNHDAFEYEPGSEYYNKLEDFYDRTMLYMQENPACKDVGFPTL